MRFIFFILSTITSLRSEFIEGTVYDNDTNVPVENVNIFLSDFDIGTITDENGSFKLNSLDTGLYILNASMIG